MYSYVQILVIKIKKLNKKKYYLQYHKNTKGINLTRDVWVIYTKNCQTLLREIKDLLIKSYTIFRD